jgi:hypothetical protein
LQLYIISKDYEGKCACSHCFLCHRTLLTLKRMQMCITNRGWEVGREKLKEKEK